MVINLTTNKNAEQDVLSKFLNIRFLDLEDYNYVLSTLKEETNKYLRNGEKINLSDALTKIVKEWEEDAKRR